ncbi:MAG TPA: acyl-CoA dehydrogenase family protein [Acidimicrobiales bacterium]|nr:acyl-CoA dehydrogenase family protein [Acidimicrobiales bacterium]
MDFAFSEEQTELRDTVRHVLESECPVAALRAFDSATAAERRALAHRRWTVLAELGAPGMLVPETAGGLGLSDVHLVGVFEEAGRAALPEPLLETAGLAAPVLATLFPAPAASSALRSLVTDHATFAVGGIDPGVTGPTSPTTVTADGRLRTPRVVGARGASCALLACRDADSGWQLHAVPMDACTVEETPVLDTTRDVATVHWPLSSDTLLAYGVAADAVVQLMADRAAAGSAALLVGLADRMITMAADYAKERQQFGKPIGSFQAVKHLLANARVKLEFARPATYRAAWSLATAQPTVSHDASMAKAMASDAADLAARVALQVHGAIGYTWECDLHFFMKRTWALSAAWGNAATHRQLVLAQAR